MRDEMRYTWKVTELPYFTTTPLASWISTHRLPGAASLAPIPKRRKKAPYEGGFL